MSSLCQTEMTWNMHSFELFDLNHECLSRRVFFFRICFFLSQFFKSPKLNNKKKWIVTIISFLLIVKFVKNLVYELLIFYFHWINAIDFVIVCSVWFKRYERVCWSEHFYCKNFFFHKCFHRWIIFSIFFQFVDLSYIMMPLISVVFKSAFCNLNLMLILWLLYLK